jgi:succinate dehydrogenase / fumarate reductase cytochrome b subunit
MSEWTDKRPMSPHIQVWKWHVTMLGSILHRATGIANYAGAILIVLWLCAAASGYEAYTLYASLAGSPVGLVVLFGFTVSVCYHALNGVRHLVWDVGHGFKPSFASFTGWLVIGLSIVAAIAIWWATGLYTSFGAAEAI